MNFSVSWLPTAAAALTELWMAATNRQEIRSASDEIDRVLARSPLDVGESRFDSMRVLFVRPIAVYYRVNELDLKVTVESVWQVSPH